MRDRLRLNRTCATTPVPRPSRLTGVVALAATLAVGLVAAGCGSSSGGTASTATKPFTKAQVLAYGNAICAQGNQKVAAAGKTFAAAGNHAPTHAQFTAYVNTAFAPVIQHQINVIRALGARSADQATITKMLDVAQTDLNHVKSNPALLTGNSHPFANFAKLAHPYGLTRCAANA